MPNAVTPPQAQPPSFTLSVGAKLVLEDVSVTDKHGNPVHGLPASAFHVQDAGVVQHIRTFNEGAEIHTSITAKQPSRGVYTNSGLYSGAGPVTAMLLDPVSMNLPDQMYLRLQMLHYLATMPEGTQVVLFRANSRGVPVLIQSLTSDRALLTEAINKSIPTLPRPVGSLFGNGIAELANVSDYLRTVPGKKVLLWFAGSFPLYLDPNLCTVMGPVTPSINSSLTYADCGALNGALRQSFRDLEQARIAVYPIDVRGVVVFGPPPAPSRPTARPSIVNSPGALPPPDLGAGSALSAEYDLEAQMATATGGHAFYSTNGLASAMEAAVSLGRQTYTLGYEPDPYKADGRWHKVHITVDGPYQVRYRTGYYAAEAGPPGPPSARPVLTAEGVVRPPANRDAPTLSSTDLPIVFQAQVKPDGTGGKPAQVTVEYDIPTAQLQFRKDTAGREHAQLRLAVLAYNAEGDVESSAIQVIETHFSSKQMAVVDRIGTPALQSVKVGKGAQFLLLAVEDMQTQRVGTLQIPLAQLKH